MKLRNKRTGEIKELTVFSEKFYLDEIGFAKGESIKYNTLAELNEEWEDYEETKEYWFIDPEGDVNYITLEDEDPEDTNANKQIGNYFETKEEAEEAVRKLKALKRLKDEGMRKYSFHKEKTGIDLDFYTLTILAPRDKGSLDLLFGGEE